MTQAIVRFRADPRKVRVSICAVRSDDVEILYRVTIENRATGRLLSCFHNSPRKALVRALQAAEFDRSIGVDMSMDSAYRHPWKTEP